MKLPTKTSRILAASALSLSLAGLVPVQTVAQQITSGVRGVVTDPNGSPVADATVTITDSRTGRATVTSTGSSGAFQVSGLTVGGPYTVFIDTATMQDERIENLFLSLSDTANLNIQLSSGPLEQVIVTAAATVTTQLAIGPSTSFGLETLESLPSISRDIRDVIRLDPRVTINPNNENNISCLGGNNRFNSFTIDGVRTSDAFGLNASGFPNRNNLPIPFDAIRETSVEFSPYDVEYGQFTGCNINVVTKTGTNEFHGSVFGVFNSDAITGSKIDGEPAITDEFRNWNWGVDLGGPIIKDKLFFYVAYEEAKDSNAQDDGPIGGGFGDEDPDGPTVADVEQVQAILEGVYGQNTLGIGRTLPDENRRILGRIDWFINDNHRAAATYTRLREARGESDDFGFDNDFAFLNNFEIEGSNIESYSLRVFSDWTDNFSTQIRISRLDNLDLQDPFGGGEAQDANPVPRIVVNNVGANGATLLSGPGQFRSANALETTLDQIKISGEYVSGDHTFTGGFEVDRIDVFNLFAVNATGTIEFDSVEDLQAGIASEISGSGSFSGDIRDAGANFRRSIYTLYIQDEWQATNELLITFGLRYDFYQSGDNPPLNQPFVDRYGFDNTTAFNNLDVFQPRLGFSYEAPWNVYGQTTFRGGAGVFSGGDPTVWFSNAFTNFGSALGNGDEDDCTAAELQVLQGGNFTGIPDCIVQAQMAQALQGLGRVDAIDPNLKVPSIVRGSFGFTHFTDFSGGGGGFFDDWRIDLDIIHTRRRNALDFVDLTLTPIGFAPDGRNLYNAVDPLLAGCDAVFLGPRIGFSNPIDPETGLPQTVQGGVCDAGRDDQDILLTNAEGDNGGSTTLSILLNKRFDYEAFGRPAFVNVSTGYAFALARDVNPTTNSTATSSFEEVAVRNINMPVVAPTRFNNRHNVTFAITFGHDFWDDVTTRLSFFFQAREGQAFSYVYDNNTATTLFGDSDNEERNLFYVPTGPTDPLVDFSGMPAEDVTAFFAFLEETGLDKFAGQISTRNAFRDKWVRDLDMRFSQEIPLPGDRFKFEFFLDIENVLNLIDSGGNIFRRRDRGDVGEGVPILDAALNDAGQYVYTNFRPGLEDDDNVNASVWAMQIGARIRF